MTRFRRNPTAKMKIVTKCERIQPTCIGVDERGELLWEGREMADWQKWMFRAPVLLFQKLLAQWTAIAKYMSDRPETDGFDFADNGQLPMTEQFKTRGELDQRRRMYAHKKHVRRYQGD